MSLYGKEAVTYFYNKLVMMNYCSYGTRPKFDMKLITIFLYRTDLILISNLPIQRVAEMCKMKRTKDIVNRRV